jgi:hypothetical protein
MERTKVTSSQLSAVGYDPDKRVLEIEFIKGAVYQYRGVPEKRYTELMDAPSKGSYFNQNIKSNYIAEKQ